MTDLPTLRFPEDFERLGLQMRLKTSECLCYLEAMLAVAKEAGENCPSMSQYDDVLKGIRAHMLDVADDVEGLMIKTAEDLRDMLYGGISTRGPMHRKRGKEIV
jgi:hypothetical protein